MRRFKRLAVIGAVVAAVAVPTVAVTAHPAFALNAGNNWCLSTTPYCWNAWGGGPWVKQYTGGANQANGDFIWDHGLALPAQYLFFANADRTGTASASGTLSTTRTTHVPASTPAPEPTVAVAAATDGAPTGLATPRRARTVPWPSRTTTRGGWLGPDVVGVNGSQFYLNKPNPYCFKSYPTVG